jgi:serine/threonine protein kinase
MEFAEGGTLGECLKKGAIRDAGQLKSIVKMINEGLRQLHDTYNVIYQDLKPDNIYFKDAGKSQIVLADFGVSNVMETVEKKATVAAIITRLYAASELAAKTGQKYVIATPAADYFSLGITMFEMWLGETPFKGIPPVQRDYLISEESVDFPADVPSDYKALIQGLIKPNPKERWGDIQVQQWLAGQPLQGGKQTKVDNRVWNSKGGKACKTPEDIALALEAESMYYKEDLKNPNASLYQYFRDVEGAQGAEISEVFCKYFEEYPPEQALAMVCSMLKGA